MIRIDDKYYVLNTSKIMEFINYSENKTILEKEISDEYGIPIDEDGEQGELQLVSKNVREVSTGSSGQIDNLRYDYIKMLVVQIITSEKYSGNELNIGEALCINTLINDGFLIEVK